MEKIKKYMTIEELIEYLPEQPSIFTVYLWTSKNKIPYKKIGRKLFFEKHLIDEWNDNNRQIIR